MMEVTGEVKSKQPALDLQQILFATVSSQENSYLLRFVEHALLRSVDSASIFSDAAVLLEKHPNRKEILKLIQENMKSLHNDLQVRFPHWYLPDRTFHNVAVAKQDSVKYTNESFRTHFKYTLSLNAFSSKSYLDEWSLIRDIGEYFLSNRDLDAKICDELNVFTESMCVNMRKERMKDDVNKYISSFEPFIYIVHKIGEKEKNWQMVGSGDIHHFLNSFIFDLGHATTDNSDYSFNSSYIDHFIPAIFHRFVLGKCPILHEAGLHIILQHTIKIVKMNQEDVADKLICMLLEFQIIEIALSHFLHVFVTKSDGIFFWWLDDFSCTNMEFEEFYFTLIKHPDVVDYLSDNDEVLLRLFSFLPQPHFATYSLSDDTNENLLYYLIPFVVCTNNMHYLLDYHGKKNLLEQILVKQKKVASVKGDLIYSAESREWKDSNTTNLINSTSSFYYRSGWCSILHYAMDIGWFDMVIEWKMTIVSEIMKTFLEFGPTISSIPIELRKWEELFIKFVKYPELAEQLYVDEIPCYLLKVSRTSHQEIFALKLLLQCAPKAHAINVARMMRLIQNVKK